MRKKKSGKRRRFRLRLVHLLLLFALIYVSSTLISQNKLMNNLNAKKDKIQSEVDNLEKDIAQLNEEIENSDSLEFVEKIAREELGMVKPREIIYIDRGKAKNKFFNFGNKNND